MTKIAKIGLSAGHGRFTAGKRCLKSIDSNETREWILNDRIATKIEDKLRDYNGIETYRLDDRTGQRNVPLKERTDMANKLKLDFVDDIHHNAGIKGGSGGGITVIRHHITGQATKDYQDIMYDKLIKHTGLKGNRSNPKPTQNLHMCRETDMSTLTVEHGFMDSTTDTPIILTEEFAEQCANAHVEFYVDVFDLKRKQNVHWAEQYYNSLIDKGIKVTDTDFDKSITLGNTYKLFDELTDGLEKEVIKEPEIEIEVNEVSNLLVYNRTLKLGAKGEDVKALQLKLKSLNFYSDIIDGSFGGNTDKAVRAYQKINGLTVDGSVGLATITSLNNYKAIPNNTIDEPKDKVKEEVASLIFNGVLKLGSKGNYVMELQKALVQLGYDTKGIDGSFGNGCLAAVKNFQRDNGLVIDGLFGLASHNKINELLSGKNTPIDNSIKQCKVIKYNEQTTVVKIPVKNIEEIDVIVANTKTSRETLSSMKKRTNVDFIISGGLWWTDSKDVSHSLNLLLDEFKQIQSGVYSRFGLMTYRDKSYKLGWYKWEKDLKDMLGGSPSLVIDGRINIDTGTMKGSIMTNRHPRAGIGLNDDYLFLVTVDGRQKGKLGATINEFANLMLEIGCINAIGGDGGGTVRMESMDRVLNSPTENRPSNNAIGIKLKGYK